LRAGRTLQPMLSRPVGFWLVAVMLVLVLCAASAPTPLYGVYQSLFGFPTFTLTAIYGVFAIAGLATLLTSGRLSDHIGRRPVLLAALGGEIAGMLAFVAASDVPMLFVGRALTGLATGAALGTISAWLLDLQPTGSSIASLVNGVATLLGLASGALIAGFLVEFAPDPLHLVFWLLAALYAVSAVVALAIPDPTPRRPGWRSALRPALAVPEPARPMFLASAPSLVGTFGLTGLYLSLGPSLAAFVLQTDSRAVGGLVVLALAGTGAVSAALLFRANPTVVLMRAPVALIGGVGVTIVGVWADSILLLFAGSVIAGIGLGPAFSAFLRTVAPLAPADERAALLSATYVLIYLSFSVPAVIAGVAVTVFGLEATTYAYGLAVMALAAATTVAVSRRLAAVTPARAVPGG
jgi:MFS family permease